MNGKIHDHESEGFILQREKYFPQLTYRVNAISIKIQTFLVENDMLMLKFIWKSKRPRIA